MKKGYGIVLNEWLFDDRIKKELRLLIYISSLTAKNGTCFASNEHFSEKFNEAPETISRRIKKLIDLGFILAKYEMYGSIVNKRYLTINTDVETINSHCPNDQPPVDETVNRTVDETVKYNITSDNNISFNKETKNQKTKPLTKHKFLEIYNDLRKRKGGFKHSNYNRLSTTAEMHLKDLSKQYTEDDFRKAITACMIQVGSKFENLKSNTEHILRPEYFEQYLDAYYNRNKTMYEKPQPKKQVNYNL